MEAISPGSKLLIAVIAASSVLGVIILFLLYIYYRKYKKNSQKNHRCSSTCLRKRYVSKMDYKTIELATNNFQDSNILGVGGFGCVYKGKLEEGICVAVKRLAAAGNVDALREFQTEVELLSKIQHPNIITLLGYGIQDEKRLLIYEFMHYGSLETQLHGPSKGSALTWLIRMKIALDVARCISIQHIIWISNLMIMHVLTYCDLTRGLEYVHDNCHPSVIHRDLKSSNILLDSNFNAKISDFGLAVLNGRKNKNYFKLSGTVGYVAPEYLLDGELTEKSDVYAFGVVLLELLLGRKPLEKVAPDHCQSIVKWFHAGHASPHR